MMPLLKYFRGKLWDPLFFLFVFWSSACFGQTHLDSLRSSFEQETNDSLKIVYEMGLAREIHRHEHKRDEDLFYALDAVERALNLKDTLLYARSLDNLGLLYRYHQHYDEALSFHIKAFNLIEDRNVKPIYKMIFANNAGVAGRYDQQYDSAIFYYMKALKIAEKENNLRNIAISSNGIGNALGNIEGREEEALKYFERSLKTEKKRGNDLGVAMNYLSISDYYIGEKQFDKAREYLEELLQINEARNDKFGLAITYEFFGKSYLEEGKNLGKASFYFQNGLNRFQKLGDAHKQAEILLSLGNIKLHQNDIQEARTFFHNSLALAQDLDIEGLIMRNSYKLADIYERKNNSSRALDYFKQGKHYEDSIKLAEQHIEIAELIRKYDLEKKENHIQLLEKDKALQQTLLTNQKQKLDRRRTFMLLMGIGLVLVLIIFLMQYRNSQIKKKTNEKIQKEEREKIKAIYERNLARAEILVTRLQINPHFLFNSLNAITYLIQSEQNSKAMRYLVVFSRYTRMVLETSQKNVVSIEEELKLTQYYLTLEENRFEKDFDYHIQGDDAPELGNMFIPPLLLQPFIENAIWHGLLPSKQDTKKLILKVIVGKNSIMIIIDDNGIGRRNENSQISGQNHKSMGMPITRERIDLFNKSYSSNINYEIIDKKDKKGKPRGTRIVIELRQEEVSENSIRLSS